MKVDTPLVTKCAARLSNAIIMYVHELEDGIKYLVLSDFGNRMLLTENQILANYTIPEWHTERVDYGLPTISTSDRIDKQIELLLGAKEYLAQFEDLENTL